METLRRWLRWLQCNAPLVGQHSFWSENSVWLLSCQRTECHANRRDHMAF